MRKTKAVASAPSFADFPKNLSTYMGGKGYTIPKTQLTDEQIARVKHALTVKPAAAMPGISQTTTFPAYRESKLKLYVPRYFGLEHFGSPKETKLPEGDDIALAFNGQLRDYQTEVVRAYQTATLEHGLSGGLVNLPCGYGKTTVALNIVSVMRKKTLIIVHKEFLLNQWIERINQYLPGARVGRIQGQQIDIVDKDIVIGMLQSLSMKDYEQDMFQSFGMVLIDEVHHIGSEVFSNALFKIVPKYTLGLSATMDRKDGTTFVFKMFLGDIVYRITEKKQRNVLVRAVQYRSNDPVFNAVEYDFRGNPAFSTMISKLCDNIPRTEFIIRIIKDMIDVEPDQQLMVIAHNRNVLTYIHDAVRDRGIATVGYYVGGMKEKVLKANEAKQVIIATYAMCSEGLDISTLCRMIMATPRTDIEQTVGRILRSNHEQPVVVDIVDSHEPFQKQFVKRRQFYKRENYDIVKTVSTQYQGEATMWELVYKAKVKGATKKEEKEEKEEEDEEEEAPVRQCLFGASTFAEFNDQEFVDKDFVKGSP